MIAIRNRQFQPAWRLSLRSGALAASLLPARDGMAWGFKTGYAVSLEHVNVGLRVVTDRRAAMPPGRLALAARMLGDLARSERPDVAATVVDLATVGGNGQC